MSSGYFNYDVLNGLSLNERPYRYVLHDSSVFHSDLLEPLSSTFPETSKLGHNNIDELDLPAPWEAFKREIRGDAYRKCIERLCGLSLLHHEVGIGVRYWSKESHGKPHSDVPRKKVTHLIYFNESWPHSGGNLRVLKSKNLKDVHESFTPLSGHGIVFVVTRHAYHGFEPFEGVRKAIQINFEHTGLKAKLTSRYPD